ncbi:hypothetical protein PYV61_16655 [Roseisolibacter sp. H3M3-2]|nr:hypothetical protein [Roseisolibacter sp. H3M3-2]
MPAGQDDDVAPLHRLAGDARDGGALAERRGERLGLRDVHVVEGDARLRGEQAGGDAAPHVPGAEDEGVHARSGDS